VPVRRVGTYFELDCGSLRLITLKQALNGLELSSELAESTYLASSAALNVTGVHVTIPVGLTLNLDKAYVRDAHTGAWRTVGKLQQVGDKLTLDEYVSDSVWLLPWQSFNETFYENVSNVYEMYITKTDSRVYKNMLVSSSDPSDNIVDVSFSKYKTGPWNSELSSLRLLDVFYLRITAKGLIAGAPSRLIPTRTIGLECLVCE
jgi:hypothetical protein